MITAVVKVVTDTIVSIAASPIGRYVMLVIMCVDAFKTEVIVFICNVIMGLMSR